MHLNIAIPSVIIALTGILLAYVLYRKESLVSKKVSASLGSMYSLVYNKFYIDEAYLFVTKRILFNLVSRPVAWFDRHVVDETMNRIAWVISVTSNKIKGLQSGQLQHYAMVFVSGTVILVLIILYNLTLS
jgi:NADH-quinone oxidoreductase subunit L